MEDENKLLNFKNFILKWYLRLNSNQFMQKDSKYKLLNKCFEDYQLLWRK